MIRKCFLYLGIVNKSTYCKYDKLLKCENSVGELMNCCHSISNRDYFQKLGESTLVLMSHSTFRNSHIFAIIRRIITSKLPFTF